MKVGHSGVTQGEEGTELFKAPEMPVLPTNLVRVASTYKYRSRIPQDLIKFYLPKREVTEALRTKSLAEARRLLLAMQLKFQIERASLRIAPSEHSSELVITDASIAYLTILYKRELPKSRRTGLSGRCSMVLRSRRINGWQRIRCFETSTRTNMNCVGHWKRRGQGDG